MDNLYVHLQSDSSPEFFPNNTICDFRNQLAGSLEIDPSYYEVALVQCSYVYNPPCIKAGKEIARLRVLGPVTDFCDTVRKCEQIFPDNLEYDLSSVNQDVFMLTSDNLLRYQAKSSSGFHKFTEFDHSKTSDIYRVTESVIECRLGRSVSNFDELFKYVNEKLVKFHSDISYQSSPRKFLENLHKSVHSIEFMGTYERIFQIAGEYTPQDWFTANKSNIKLNTLLFRLKVTHKIEYLGRTNHNHGLPLNLQPLETEEKLISASYYYEDNTKGTLKIQDHLYQIVLDEDVYDITGLLNQLKHKIPALKFGYTNNIVTLTYTDNVYNFYKLETSDQIKAILGLTDIAITQTNQKLNREERGIFRPFFGYGQQKMYIYADIIENQFIGSQLAPLLRITDYKGENATTTTQEFAHHHYVPIRNINLDQIHMYIRSETSDFLPIELGTFSATLHFRRKRF